MSELTMLSLSGSFLDTPSPRGSNAGLAAAATPDAGNLRLAATSPLNAVMTPKKTPTKSEPLSPGAQQVLASFFNIGTGLPLRLERVLKRFEALGDHGMGSVQYHAT